MKMKKKGKVYPSPPLPSSTHHDSLSVLKLLPTTILVLVSVLSVEDKEVLAYLITRGTTREETSNSNSKKKNKNHKPPVFDCECFDCYTNYWFRWDTSPNRELIHDIIEAFEEHHLGGENPSGNNNNNNKSKRGKKKEKVTRSVVEDEVTTEVLESVEHVSSPERLSEADVEVEEKEEKEETVGLLAVTGHKGLVRKVLPDVMGLFNSSFWRLWNPNA